MSLLIALVSLTLLIRRVREARRAAEIVGDGGGVTREYAGPSPYTPSSSPGTTYTSGGGRRETDRLWPAYGYPDLRTERKGLGDASSTYSRPYLTLTRTQYPARVAIQGTEKPSVPTVSANPCNALIVTHNETRSAIGVCSNGFTATRTATGLIRTSTQWTNLRPEPPKLAQTSRKPDAPVHARTYASKLVKRLGQRFESARRLFPLASITSCHWIGPEGSAPRLC